MSMYNPTESSPGGPGLASLEGHLDVVQVLLATEHGADVNPHGEEGLAALHDTISNFKRTF